MALAFPSSFWKGAGLPLILYRMYSSIQVIPLCALLHSLTFDVGKELLDVVGDAVVFAVLGVVLN